MLPPGGRIMPAKRWPERNLHCRFCGYSTPAWRMSKGGRAISGMSTIRRHLIHEHPDRAREIYGPPSNWEDEYHD
jgi:hypothetical protein